MAFATQLATTLVMDVGMIGVGAGLGFASPLLPQLDTQGLGGEKVSGAALPWIGRENNESF